MKSYDIYGDIVYKLVEIQTFMLHWVKIAQKDLVYEVHK